ncbi:MAG: nitroreductase family protein [Candidatus Beckwithbacteria bacterium]|nr:nitroreductase family protein [Patescibacteria group bacterium]
MIKKYPNQTIKTLLTRTCCRDYTNQPIPDQDIDYILKAGQVAPSAKNRQPWFFIVIKDQDCRQKIAKSAFVGRQRQFAGWDQEKAKQMIQGNAFDNSNDAVIAKAPVAILILRNLNPDYQEALPAELNIKEEQGVANTTFSMMLTAQSLGLNTVWICSPLYIKKELSQILPQYEVDWQNNWQPRAIIPIGYPKQPGNKPTRKPLQEISLEISS